MEVRDPIHGAIEITDREVVIVDQPFVQRLRNIRQMGFSALPFPGAVHSRYSHVVGAMHLAGRAFDAVVKPGLVPAPIRERWRATVRLAALCHDLGHAPFSHCTEFAMPMLSALGISLYGPLAGDRRAHHEDYTLAILELSPLGSAIAANFDCTARHVASLIAHEVAPGDDFFVHAGIDWRIALSQLVSSEIDVDRLDYLRRDSYYSGAGYGWIDADWILGNLGTALLGDRVHLGLDTRAIYAFDHFLLARHHMFLMVYFHHKSVAFEEMLRRHVGSKACGWAIPADLDGYLQFDDIALEGLLRATDEPWARRIVERRPYRRLVERHGKPDEVDLKRAQDRLFDAGIGVIHTASTGRLSRYAQPGKKHGAPPILVLDGLGGSAAVRTLDETSTVFERYAEERRIARLYVAPEDLERAKSAIR